uniref:Uncharacterized protein n=1 Tax=Panagrolaimus superbus TaxID=310955 RepID=A0A914XYA2_9BILA
MNALSRVVSDLTQKKNSRKLKYETTMTSTWDGDDINPMAFCSPFHDPVLQSSLSKDFDELSSKKQSHQNSTTPTTTTTTNSLNKNVPKLEHGKLDLSDIDYDVQFLKRPNPPLKRMSAAIRERFSTDFLRSKSLQKLNNKDEDQDVEVNNNPFEECKQTSSLSKIKKQARIIDVHVQQFNNSKKNNDNKNLLKHDQMESD